MSLLESAAVTNLEEQSGGNGDQNLESMDSSNIVCSELPNDIIELVLSFMPIPDLWRFQVVCKYWHKLVRKPSFFELCYRNGKHHEYLFLWRDLYSEFVVDPLFVRTLSFLDVGAGRWYSIPTAERLGCETRFMAMNDGLVCKLTSSPGMHENSVLAISNPVSKTERILPAAAPENFGSHDLRPIIVPMVDDVTGMPNKMFIIFHRIDDNTGIYLQHVYLHDILTGEWREIVDTPHEIDSAVSLHGNLYTTDRHVHDLKASGPHTFQEFVLTSTYNHHEDTWTEVSRMSFGDRAVHDPRLVVSDNRLFVIVHLDWVSFVSCTRAPVESNSPFDGKAHYSGSLQEMYEILIPENMRMGVVQFTCRELNRMFEDRGEEDPDIIPCFDSNGLCNSLVLVSHYSGKIIEYKLADKSYTDLPQHPLLPIPKKHRRPRNLRTFDPENGCVKLMYNTKNMRLSLSDLSTQQAQVHPEA